MDDEIFGVLCMGGFFYLAVFGFFIIMWWNIFKKAGYDGARAFLLLIPFVNIIIMIMFAFSEWPINRELEQLRMQNRGGNQGPQIQQISVNASAPNMMMPQQPQQMYPQPYQQPYPPQQYPPQYPQSQYPNQ